MARVTHVKRAQQKYHTKPVLDADGKPVKIALTKRDGSPKMTSSKGGKRTPRPVFITKTEPDKTRPKPLETCGKCGTTIQVGDPYKWIKPKSGPYGGRRMVRCAKCPTWNVWDYSSSLSAQVARIEYDADNAIRQAESVEDAEAVAGEAADAIRELAEQKRESAGNIEDGFGHATYQSEELESQADELDSWADEVEQVDFPDTDEYAEDDTCQECGGTGQEDNPDYDEDEALEDEDYTEPEQIDCGECYGTGTTDDPEVDLEAWQGAAADALLDVLQNCPV